MFAPAPRAPFLALRHRDYRRLIVSQLLSLTGSQMQVVAINWHVYLLTKSPLALGFVGLTRVVPIVAFSLWGGVVADRHDRRRVMIATQVAMTVVALALWGTTATDRESLWLIYVLNALSASAVAFDGPSRQALIPRLELLVEPCAEHVYPISGPRQGRGRFHRARVVAQAVAGEQHDPGRTACHYRRPGAIVASALIRHHADRQRCAARQPSQRAAAVNTGPPCGRKSLPPNCAARRSAAATSSGSAG